VVFWLLPDGPIEPRVPLSVFGPLLLVTGWLSWKYHEPAEKRSLRMAVSIYVFAGVAMTAMGLVQHFTPTRRPAAARPSKPRRRAARPPGRTSAAAPAHRRPRRRKPKKTGKNARRNEGRAREASSRSRPPRRPRRVKVFTTGSYLDRSTWRARRSSRRRPATPASRSC
jgi:hypothetical protein